MYTIRANELHYYCVTSLLAILRTEEISSILFYLSECSEKLGTSLSCDECLYDEVRINKDSIGSMLGMWYIHTQQLIRLYIYNINGMNLPWVFNSYNDLESSTKQL